MVERIIGVMRRPRSTFAAVARAPRPAGLLVLLFAVYFVPSAALFATAVGRQALVDQWESTAMAFGQQIDDARYAELQRLSERGTVYAATMALTAGPAAVVLLAAVLFAWFTGVRGEQGSYRQVLAVTAHAAVILMLRHLVAVPANYARETVASPTTLRLFFTTFDAGSPPGRFLALVDLFVVWWLIVLAIGIAVLYGQRARTVAVLFVGVYAFVVLLLTGVMAVLGDVE